ncbi:hypothetical protein, partial [Enterobacter intestinihominis]
ALTPALSHREREKTQPVGPCKRTAAGRIRRRCGLVAATPPYPTPLWGKKKPYVRSNVQPPREKINQSNIKKNKSTITPK